MSEENGGREGHNDLLRMAAGVVAAYVGKNAVASAQIPEVLQTVFATLQRVGSEQGDVRSAALKPAVAIKKSITAEYIVCLEDGKKLKMLKRHLRTNFNMTPEQYRAKWGLPADYPMVASSYAAQRSAFAKKIGLGRKATDGGAKRARRAKSSR